MSAFAVLRRRGAVVAATTALFFLAFFGAPLAAVFVMAVGPSSLGDFVREVGMALGSARMASIVSFTVGQAALSATLAVAVAIPGAWLISHRRFPGRRIVYSLSLIPFVLPSIIVVVALITFWGRNGLVSGIVGRPVNLVYNFRGIILAHVFYNFSLAIRIIATAWAGIDRRYREGAESLGDSSAGITWRVTLPLLTPAITSAYVLVFMYSFMSFGVVLVFGGVRWETLEVAIYRAMFVDLDLERAAMYAFVQLVFSGLFIGLSSRSLHQARGGLAVDRGELPSLKEDRRVVRVLAGFYVAGILLFVLGPLLTMAVRSFVGVDGALTLDRYRLLFGAGGDGVAGGPPVRSVSSILRSSVAMVILRSIAIAGASGTFTLTVALGLALTLRGSGRRVVDGMLQIPLGVSLVTVALGLRLLWYARLPPVVLIVIGQFFVAFPLVYRIVRSGVEELSDRVVEAAEILGAPRLAILRDIELPLLRRTVLNGWAYALALPFADLTVVMTIGRGRIATFPVAIWRLIGARSFDLALALAVVYIVICLVLFRIIDSTSLEKHAL